MSLTSSFINASLALSTMTNLCWAFLTYIFSNAGAFCYFIFFYKNIYSYVLWKNLSGPEAFFRERFSLDYNLTVDCGFLWNKRKKTDALYYMILPFLFLYFLFQYQHVDILFEMCMKLSQLWAVFWDTLNSTQLIVM